MGAAAGTGTGVSMARANEHRIVLAPGQVFTVRGLDDDFVTFYRADGEFRFGLNGAEPTLWGAQGITYQRGQRGPIDRVTFRNDGAAEITILMMAGEGAFLDTRGSATQSGIVSAEQRSIVVGGDVVGHLRPTSSGTTTTLVSAAANVNGVRINHARCYVKTGQMQFGYHPTVPTLAFTNIGNMTVLGWLDGTGATAPLTLNYFEVNNLVVPAGFGVFLVHNLNGNDDHFWYSLTVL